MILTFAQRVAELDERSSLRTRVQHARDTFPPFLVIFGYNEAA